MSVKPNSTVMRLLRLLVLSVMLSVVIACSTDTVAPKFTPTSTPMSAQIKKEVVEMKQYSESPPLTIDLKKEYLARVNTDKGTIVIELFAEGAPNTVNNFVFLARDGYYDNTTFHRVLPGFMAQGGDPTGSGRGGPGYRFADEFNSDLRHDGPGVLSMANSGPNTNGSQFFITYAATPHLDGAHAVFGKVVEGIEVLNNLTPRDPNQNPTFPGDTLLSIDIDEKSKE